MSNKNINQEKSCIFRWRNCIFDLGHRFFKVC
nr:MAG TPA: hypothetical protein [Caudoviricetes sp.]